MGVISRALGWLSSVVAAGWILESRTPIEFAKYALVQSLCAIGSLLDLGSATAFTEFGALSLEKTDRANFYYRIAKTRIIKAVSLFSVATLAVAATIYSVAPNFDLSSILALLVAITFAGINQLAAVKQRWLSINLLDYKTSIVNLFASFASALVVLGLAKFKFIPAEWVATTAISTSTLINFVSASRVRLDSGNSISEQVKNDEVSGFTCFSNKISVICLAGAIGGTIDTSLICMLLSIDDVSRYFMANRVFMAAALIQLSANQLWPIMARKWQNDKATDYHRKIKPIILFSGLAGLGAAIAASVLVILYATYINPQYGIRFSEIIPLAILTICGALGGVVMATTGRPEKLTRVMQAHLVFAATALLLKLTINNNWGLTGYLWASVVAYVMGFFLPLRLLLKNSSLQHHQPAQQHPFPQ